jgi:RHS repeat-associated protein
VLDDIHNGLSSADGGNVVLDFVDPDGSGAQPMAMSKRYLYGEAVDQIFAQEDLSKTLGDATRNLWPLVDHLGTVRDLAKQDGTIAVHYKYDSFGNVTAGDTSKTRYLFTSREFDTATKLQYNRARYHDAAVGRWISEDPLGFVAGDANVWRYVNNSTLTYCDCSGRQTRDNGPRQIAEIGNISISRKGKDPYPVKIIAIGDKTITIEYKWNDKTKTTEWPITDLIDSDQEMIGHLKIVPPNIVIEPRDLVDPGAQHFVRRVIDDLGNMYKLPTGKVLIDDITHVALPVPQKLKGVTYTPGGNWTPIIIIPWDGTVNGKPDSKIRKIDHDGRGLLNSKRPPEVNYNPGSGVPGLGKELWHGLQQISGKRIQLPDPGLINFDRLGLPTRDALAGEMRK